MIKTEPKILVAAPIQNRGWILPYYLDHLFNLLFPKNQLGFYFLINNTTDNSREILFNFKNQHEHEYNEIYIDTYPTPKNMPQDERTNETRMRYTYQHLSNLRNDILDYAKKNNYTYLYSVDSDILVEPDSLTRLLSHNITGVTASLIYNGYKFSPEKPYLYPNILRRLTNGKYEHIVNYYVKNAPNEGKLLDVDATGACSLISREVFNCRYGYNDQGEDIAFSIDCENNGFRMVCDTGVLSHHMMDEQMLSDYLNKNK